MTRRRLAHVLALGVGVGVGVNASMALPARAQSRDAAAAQRLFEEGRVLTARGHLDEGCAKFAASEALDPAVGTLLNLGTCAERAGANATAWRRYREAAALAVDRADPVREAVARRGIDRVEATLPRLALAVAPRGLPPGAVVRVDGTPLGAGELGRPFPVDPGPHAVAVAAPGYREWSTSAAVGEGPEVVTVMVPALEPASATATAPATATATATAPATAPTTAARPLAITPATSPALASSGGATRTWAWVAGGTALVALGVGTIFGASAASKWSTVRAQCPGGRCPDEATAARLAPSEDDASHAATASTVGFVVGGVALAVSALLFLLPPAGGDRGVAIRFP
jgi:hypothetical protein